MDRPCLWGCLCPDPGTQEEDVSRAKGIEFEDGLKAARRLTFHAGGHPGLSLRPCCRENQRGGSQRGSAQGCRRGHGGRAAPTTAGASCSWRRQGDRFSLEPQKGPALPTPALGLGRPILDSELQNWKTDKCVQVTEFAGMCNRSQGKAIGKPTGLVAQ